MYTNQTHRTEALRIAAVPAVRTRLIDMSVPASVAGVGVVDKVIAVGLLSITAILLLISLVIVG